MQPPAGNEVKMCGKKKRSLMELSEFDWFASTVQLELAPPSCLRSELEIIYWAILKFTFPHRLCPVLNLITIFTV